MCQELNNKQCKYNSEEIRKLLQKNRLNYNLLLKMSWIRFRQWASNIFFVRCYLLRDPIEIKHGRHLLAITASLFKFPGNARKELFDCLSPRPFPSQHQTPGR